MVPYTGKLPGNERRERERDEEGGREGGKRERGEEGERESEGEKNEI